MTAIGENLTTYVALSGPFFQRDPGKTLYANIHDMLEKLAAEMEEDVRSDLAANQGAIPDWTGRARDAVVGYTTSPRTKKHWALWAAVGVPNVGTKAQAVQVHAEWYGRHQGSHGTTVGLEARFHPFRRLKSAVYHARAFLSADLAKNLE